MPYIIIALLLLVFLLISLLDDFFSGSDDDSSRNTSKISSDNVYTRPTGNQTSFLYEKTSTDKIYAQLSPRYDAEMRLYGAVVAFNPRFPQWTSEDFENADFFSYDEQYWILTYAKLGVQKSIRTLTDVIMKEQTSFSYRRDLIHNMFKLAKIGDGIKDDEWNFIMKAMGELKMNGANTSYLQRLYWNFRTGKPSGEHPKFHPAFTFGHNLARVINEVLELSSNSPRKKKMIDSFYKDHYHNESGALKVIGTTIDDLSLKDATDKISLSLDIHSKRDFMHLLFKLAAEDDGIKYDEWLLLSFLLGELKLQKSADYFKHRYGSLRTEAENFEAYSNFSSKYYGYGDSNGHADSNRTKQQSSSNSSSQKTAPVSPLLDAYEVLEIKPTATQTEVQEAYHRLALLHHPDLPRNAERRAESVKKMAQINMAYASISAKKK